MPRQPIDPDKLRRFFECQANGADFMTAAMTSGISPATAQKYQDALAGIGEPWRIKAVQRAIEAFPSRDQWGPRDEFVYEPSSTTILDPIPKSELSTEALNALYDIEYFAERYFGFKLAPWQKMAAEEIIKLLGTDQKEYACINVAPGSGKPVSVDALVQMGDGSYKRLGDVQIGDYVITHMGRPRKVTEVFDQGWLEAVEVTDDYGRKTVAALDHPFMTEWGWIAAAELDGYAGKTVQAEIVTGTYLKEEEFRLAGYFVGDGSSVGGNARFTCGSPSVKEDIEYCAKTLGWTPRTVREGPNSCDIRLVQGEGKGRGHRGKGSVQFWLREAGLYGVYSGQKQVPPWVFKGPNSHVAQFIGAYFDCDGTVAADGNGIEFFSTSWDLLSQTQSLLTRLGINSSLVQKKGRYKGEVHLSWRLRVQDRARFAAIIPLHNDARAKRVRLALESRPSGRGPFGELSTKPVGKVECKCLTVEEDHSFTANDFVVSNTAFFTLVIPSWLICKDRTIRGMTGHVGANIAKQEVDNLRRTLERDVPMRATDSDLKWGTGKDAVATLAEDYGRFKPLPSENAPWRAEYFTVAQLGGIPTAEKERTWSAFGYTSSYIGTRVNFAVWDDADDADKVSDLTRDQIKRKWDDVAEKRIEPGGLLVLQGQRLGGDDLYRHVLDKRAMPDDIDDLDSTEESEWPKMYKHIVFKAHYQDKCKGKLTHKRTSPPWPEGCLLVPTRISWSDLQKERLNNPKGFETLYQQEDIARKHVLVQSQWITGGTDPDTGEEYIGCWDEDRGLCEWPRGLVGSLFSIATVDPSPSNQWAIQWWAVHPDSGQRFLLDLIASPLTAPDVLDWNVNKNDWTGILQEWQQRSVFLGLPISHWIIEANAAQRFILQYEHVKRWRMKYSVDIIPHQTNVNKSDKDYGVWSLAPHYRYGRVRLPGTVHARQVVQRLVNEVTRYPDARYDDQVMANWFMEWNLPNLTIRSMNEDAVYERPSWASNLAGRLLVRK